MGYAFAYPILLKSVPADKSFEIIFIVLYVQTIACPVNVPPDGCILYLHHYTHIFPRIAQSLQVADG